MSKGLGRIEREVLRVLHDPPLLQTVPLEAGRGVVGRVLSRDRRQEAREDGWIGSVALAILVFQIKLPDQDWHYDSMLPFVTAAQHSTVRRALATLKLKGLVADNADPDHRSNTRTLWCAVDTEEVSFQGYSDGRDGCGFPPDYDRYTAFQQRLYQRGRASADAWLKEHGEAEPTRPGDAP